MIQFVKENRRGSLLLQRTRKDSISSRKKFVNETFGKWFGGVHENELFTLLMLTVCSKRRDENWKGVHTSIAECCAPLLAIDNPSGLSVKI
jgi:hypothetical protein